MACDGILILYATFKLVYLKRWVINLVYFTMKVRKQHFPSRFIVCGFLVGCFYVFFTYTADRP